jgi:hypothetical protein
MILTLSKMLLRKLKPQKFLRHISTTNPKKSARFYETAEEATKDIPDGARLLVGG